MGLKHGHHEDTTSWLWLGFFFWGGSLSLFPNRGRLTRPWWYQCGQLIVMSGDSTILMNSWGLKPLLTTRSNWKSWFSLLPPWRSWTFSPPGTNLKWKGVRKNCLNCSRNILFDSQQNLTAAWFCMICRFCSRNKSKLKLHRYRIWIYRRTRDSWPLHCFATLLYTVDVQEGHLGHQRLDVLGGDRPLSRSAPCWRGRVGCAALGGRGSQLSRQRWKEGLGYGPGPCESSLTWNTKLASVL